MTDEERELFANQEKEAGNEYYKTNEYDKAIKYYTRSITIHATAAGYNNRAAACTLFKQVFRYLMIYYK